MGSQQGQIRSYFEGFYLVKQLIWAMLLFNTNGKSYMENPAAPLHVTLSDLETSKVKVSFSVAENLYIGICGWAGFSAVLSCFTGFDYLDNTFLSVYGKRAWGIFFRISHL